MADFLTLIRQVGFVRVKKPDISLMSKAEEQILRNQVVIAASLAVALHVIPTPEEYESQVVETIDNLGRLGEVTIQLLQDSNVGEVG